MKILIIEDELSMADSIATFLEMEGYICEIASSYTEGLQKASIYEYDCILIDIGLPDGNGLDIIRKLKARKDRAGIIIISAKDSLEDKLEGLKLGSDDYLTKPFHLPELNARIKAVVRRKFFDGDPSITFREIEVALDEQLVFINEKAVPVTRSEFSLLLFFMANQNRVLTKESIAEHINGDDADLLNSINFIYSHVKNLRKKLVRAGGQDYIQSVYGIGYKWSDK